MFKPHQEALSQAWTCWWAKNVTFLDEVFAFPVIAAYQFINKELNKLNVVI